MPRVKKSKKKSKAFFNEEQFGVVKAAILGTFINLGIFYLLYVAFPLKVPSLESNIDKIVFTLKWSVFPLITMFIGIITVANSRFFSKAINPLIDAESDRQKVHIKYLNNTHEQLFLFVLTNLILSTFLQGENLRVIAIICIIFTIARIVFWLGYLQAPVKRALGMFMTELVVFPPLFYAAYMVIKEMIL